MANNLKTEKSLWAQSATVALLSLLTMIGIATDSSAQERLQERALSKAITTSSREKNASEKNTSSATGIVLLPPTIEMAHQGDQQRVQLIAQLADGSMSDVTADAELKLETSDAATIKGSVVYAATGGKAELRAQWNGLSATSTIRVTEGAEARPLRFRNDVLPVLTKSGCNAGKCHGAASGKDGFQLSLYGFDPEGDFYRLTREMSGRRIDLAQPESCLLVNKAIGEVPHTGGACITPGSTEHRVLVTWIARGARPDPAGVPLPVSIEVFPRQIVMMQPAMKQSLIVVAKYDDGSTRDVTDLAVFISNNDAVATVTNQGTVDATGPGSGFVMARFDQFTAGTSIVVRSGKSYPEMQFEPNNYIDTLAMARWKDLHVLPSPLCSDEVFLRRVYLDIAGRLPSLEQQQSFLNSNARNKRELLVDELLESKDYLDMWAMQLAELLQIRNANGLSSKGLQLYDAWLREKVHQGTSVDQILRQLIPASGSTFENPATTYYQTETTPQLLAENIAQAFLGTRIQCAQCHNHPFDRWTMDDYYGFAGFVSQVGYKQAKDPREITVYNLGEGSLQHPVPGRKVQPKFLGGQFAETESGADLREALAIWLTSSENNAFTNNIANVVWAHYIGLGIVNPVDDVRVSNPPSNPALLDAMGHKLVEYKFDVKKLVRDICCSKTYQLATQTTAWNEWDDRNFSHARIRRLRAEVLLDCISQVTGTTDKLAGLPLGGRAIEVPNGDSNNYFLSTFGRASRNTPCSCEVSTAPTLSQALHLLNGENTTAKIIDGGWIDQQFSNARKPLQVASDIYLTCLTRSPTASETQAIETRLATSSDVKADLVDLFWAVLNSNEFIFNH